MSQRLFVALRPPADVRAALLALSGGIEGARWQTDDQLHLTLAFIGEVDRHGAEAAHEALLAVKGGALDLALGGPGTFDAGRPDRIATLWVAVEPAEALGRLAAAVRHALRRTGLAPEARRFVPHITLARFGAGGAPREALAGWLGSVSVPPARWRAEAFHLVESRLGRAGAHYQPLHRYPL
ncbi:MAG: RNA 2',3'-cyclic phosphodiesterase [Sphingomonadaceae bacterium]